MPLTLATLTQATSDAANRYTKLVLLIGPQGAGKTELLREYAHHTGSVYTPVGSMVAERLLTTSPRFRDSEADKVLRDLCQGAGPFLLDNLEILFDPSLELDPFRLLVGLARTRVMVACWPGSFHNGTLTYASPGHREYRSLTPTEAICLAF